MYKIIGGDQKEYGPATADEVRAWIAEGRLNSASLVQPEGSPDWKRLGTLPEFADALTAQSGTAGSVPPLPGARPSDFIPYIMARPAKLRIGRALGLSWKLLMENFGLFFAACGLVWFTGFLSEFNIITLAIYGVLKGVFFGGLYLVFLNRIRNQPAYPGQVLSGFNQNFAQLLLAGFISALLSWLGVSCCLILPGIYLFIAWIFSVPLVADRRLEFWSAMELSRKVVSRVWFEMFALFLVAFLPFILINVGVLIKNIIAGMPILQQLMAINPPDLNKMKEILAQAPRPSLVLMLAAQLVYLINLPFAIGALMYAYEDLFGAGSEQAN